MKKILLAISFIVAGFTYCNAQEIILDSVSSGFHDIYTAMDGHAFYTFYKTEKPGGKMATLVLMSFTRDLNINKKTRLEVPQNSYVIASALSNDIYYIILADAGKRTLTRIAVDANGKVIKKTVDEKQPSSTFLAGNGPRVIPAMPEGFIVITPATENKKHGYKLERFNRNLESQWDKTFLPESGSWDVINIYPVMERLTIVRKETEGNHTNYTIHTVQGDQGETMLTTQLNDGQDICIPTTYKTKDDFNVVAGLVYEDNKTGKSTSIFMAVLGPAGDKQKFIKIPFSQMADSIKGNTISSIAEGKTGLFVDDVLRIPGGYAIVSEAYNRASSSKETHFKIGDFILAEVNDEGQLTKAYMHQKAAKEAIVTGTLADMTDRELAQWLAAQHFFSYKAGSQMRIPTIAFQTDDTASNLQILSFTDNEGRPAQNVAMNKLKVKNSNNFIFDNSSGNDDYIKSPYANVMQGDKEMMLFYQYSKPRLVIWFSPNLIQ